MKWFCQSPGAKPTAYKKERDCTNQHVVCTLEQAAHSQLVVFLPGTGLVPQDYSEIVADFAGHGFHSLGLMYPSTQGQADCAMSRTAKPMDLNCTARERYRVLTGSPNSYGGTDTHTNITKVARLHRQPPIQIAHEARAAVVWLASAGWLAGLGSDHCCRPLEWRRPHRVRRQNVQCVARADAGRRERHGRVGAQAHLRAASTVAVHARGDPTRAAVRLRSVRHVPARRVGNLLRLACR